MINVHRVFGVLTISDDETREGVKDYDTREAAMEAFNELTADPACILACAYLTDDEVDDPIQIYADYDPPVVPAQAQPAA
jgi:hypothetical protein